MKYLLFLLTACIAFADNSEQALRARAAKFLQAYVDGKARTMEPLVAEESKDEWFSSEKPRYGSFEITKVELEQGGAKAKVTAMVETVLKAMGNNIPVKIPTAFHWKLEGGEWRYFIDPNEKERQARKVTIPKPAELLGKVTASKNEIKLCGCGEPMFEVGIRNDMPGQVRLSLNPIVVPGLRVSLKESVLAANQSTKVILEYDGAEKPPTAPVPLVVNVSPTGEQVVIKLIFTTTI